jgi:nickel superoxide dismutase
MFRQTFDSLTSRALRGIDRLAPPRNAHAHCDVPCGIYNPVQAEIAADTVIKMTEKLMDLGDSPASGAAALTWENSAARFVVTKEEHAEKVKREVLILWTDYFKPEHLQKYPDLHELVWKTCKVASKTKQEVNMEAAQELRANVGKIGEIFWETKKG